MRNMPYKNRNLLEEIKHRIRFIKDYWYNHMDERDKQFLGHTFLLLILPLQIIISIISTIVVTFLI